MHDLTPITALGGDKALIETIANLTCTEVPDVALAAVMARLGGEAQTKAALATLLESAAPDVEHWAGGDIRALWIGPDQWMLEAPFQSHEDLAALVKEKAGDHASVVEQSDAWARFDIAGADVLAVMELLCNLDCRRMQNNHVKRSSIHHLACIVRRLSDDSFALYGPRASAGSLHHAIKAAMLSVAA